MKRSEIRGFVPERERTPVDGHRAAAPDCAWLHPGYGEEVVRYRRNFVAGGTYFFTVTLKDRRSRVLVEHIGAVRTAFRAARRDRPFAIDAIVVLPDHLHAIITLPEGDADFSGRWRQIKSLFSRRVAGETGLTPNRKGEYSIWQRRFWEHTIRDDDDFSQHFDYIHFNPVRHGLVDCAEEWTFSSFHRYVRLGWMPRDWGAT